MRALILLHRWLGVAFCLLFAMWFASGIVMHFVPFPALTEAERFAGLAPIDLASVEHGPAEAVGASGIDGRHAHAAGAAKRWAGLSDRWLVARGRASRRRSFGCRRAFARLGAGDCDAIMRATAMWMPRAADVRRAERSTISGPCRAAFDPHRPLYRIALNDAPGTELYVSSTTGEVVLDTARRERAGIMSAASRTGFIRRHCAATRRHGAGWYGGSRSWR